MTSLKIRQAATALFGILLIILCASVATGLFGWNIPGLRAIADLIGVSPSR